MKPLHCSWRKLTCGNAYPAQPETKSEKPSTNRQQKEKLMGMQK